MRAFLIAVIGALFIASTAHSDEPIRLVREFTLSPDGSTLYFAWRGDIWSAATKGGAARRLTSHLADERFPRPSRDGKSLAFVSNRTGANQVYVMASGGGAPEQVTFHSEGSLVADWFPDGKSLLIKGSRDHFWRRADRYFLKKLDDSAPVLLFDGEGRSAQLSPDGRHLLFAREGVSWWRKGYVGSQSSQVWTFDTASRDFSRLTNGAAAERSPLWHPDGKRYYYVGQQDGTFNLYRRSVSGSPAEKLTAFEDDGVHFPALSLDGSVIVFRHMFDLYRLATTPGAQPERIELVYAGDKIHPRTVRQQLAAATQAAFSDDGREVAFISGGDVWVMDTELKEPRRITDTPGDERDPVFAPDHGSILYVSESGEDCDLFRATRKDAKRHWWQNDEFEIKRLTHDPEPEFGPRFVAGGKIAFTNLRGDLWTMKPDGKELRLVFSSWSRPDYWFSPDGEWVAYAIDDDDFNRDIWIRKSDGTGDAVNVTRHPDWEGNPVWSPDGKMLAFVGQRNHQERDIHFVYLKKADDDRSRRDRTVDKAEKKMAGRKKKAPKKAAPKSAVMKFFEKLARNQKKEKKKDVDAKDEKPKPKAEQKKAPSIDFDGIADRIRRVTVPQVDESGLFWSHDSKKLAFRAKIDGKEGIWTIEPPDDLKPKFLSASKGSGWRWLKEGNQIVGLASGRPTSVSARGAAKPFAFRVPVEVDVLLRNGAAFDLCWRTMRDNFYDPRLNNRNWSAVRKKYRGMAGECVTTGELSQVVLGFSARGGGAFKPPAWRETTPHFGARLDPLWKGPGLRVESVVKGSPGWRKKSRLLEGDVILSVDGKAVDPTKDIGVQLNGRLDRDLRLAVKGKDGKERAVVIRPTSYGMVRRLLYDDWIDKNRAVVDKASDNRLGYLHVRGMNWSSFERFEAELYKVGHGKDGLLIDVRNNGGGFTADHLLTCLCQPSHAVTIPRGGGKGYPQGRLVYARWDKPIVVLCNQNSFSNAEIFSHAIRSLKRGRIVGVQTAGGVISTGGRSIMGFGYLRMPFRGWFVAPTGEDMELNGCRPDIEIWPEPEEWTRGTDRQLAKAIEFLLEDVASYKARPKPALRYRSQELVGERGLRK
ncbi:MAG: S41 family peptidase [Planctomycetota bacterium]|jgi:tricorn protease